METETKKPRRKYAFADRAAAEDAYSAQGRELSEYRRALSAAFRGDLRALPPIGPYAAYMYGRRYSVGLVLLQPGTDAPETAYDCEQFCDWVDRQAGEYDADLRRVAYHARRIMYAYWKMADRPDGRPADIAQQIAAEFDNA